MAAAAEPSLCQVTAVSKFRVMKTPPLTVVPFSIIAAKFPFPAPQVAMLSAILNEDNWALRLIGLLFGGLRNSRPKLVGYFESWNSRLAAAPPRLTLHRAGRKTKL